MRLNHIFPFLLLSLLFCQKSLAQDTLIFENNWRFPVYVEEEREQEVVYRRPDLQKSPAYVIDKRFIVGIRYEDPEAGKLKFRKSPVLERELDAWVTLMDTSANVKGLLADLNDSMLVLRKKQGFLEGGNGVKTDVLYLFPYRGIQRIEVRQRNKIAKYAAWGALGGFALGTLSGLIVFKNEPPCDKLTVDGMTKDCDKSLNSPHTKWEKSLKLGFAAGGAGFLGGGIVGSVRIKIPIGGQKNAYHQAIPKLERLAKGFGTKKAPR